MGVNVAMWSKAVRGLVGRMEPHEWAALDIVAQWLIAARAQVLVMTFLSAALGGLLALAAGRFALFPWLLVTAGLVLAHATNNLLNDLTDFWRGVDHDNYFRAQYGPHPLAHNLMPLRGVLLFAGVTGGAALALGLYLMSLAADPGRAWILLGLGAVFVLFYTFPLKYIGLGELAVLVVWGPLMIGGTYFMVTGVWEWNVVWAGLPYALGVTGVIFGKHIDKLAVDRAKGIHTLPVLLGEARARAVAVGLLAAQYVLVVYLVLTGFFSPALLVVFLAAPTFGLVSSALRQPRPAAPPAGFPADIWPLWYVAFAFEHNRRFGFFFLLGLLADLALKRLGIW
ncbi:MAG: prenyltransferase [Anaerolineales bacterium]|nr:prenyltransferase [Anaerolineales bacterium]